MYFQSQAAKSTAKVTLKGRWPMALGVCAVLLLTLLFQAAVQQLMVFVLRTEYIWSPGDALEVLHLFRWNNVVATLVTLALEVFLYTPVKLGAMRWFWRLTGGVPDPVGEMFYYFSNVYAYRRALAYVFQIGWRLLVAGVVVYLPYVFVSMVTRAEVFGSQVSTALSVLMPVTGLFAVAGVVLYVVYCLRFFLAPWLLFSYESLSVQQVLQRSVQMTRSYKSGYVGFLLTFIGWLLLCLPVLPLMYVLPWLLAAMAVYGRYCINHYYRVQAQATGTFAQAK